jgi:hypothetical protein
MTSPIVLRREELYERVWKEPLVRVAKEFGLSDRGLAKVCVRMEIPLPGRGYWRQVETGRSMKRKPLPKLKKGRSEVRIYPHSAPETAPTSSEEDPRVEFEKRKGNRILVQPELSEPLPLIERTRSALSAAKPDGERMVTPRTLKALDVRIGAESVPRALRLLDALLKGLNDRGLKVKVSQDGARKTWVTVDGEEIPLALRERRKRVPHRPTAQELAEKKKWPSLTRIPEYDWVPSGELLLVIEHSSWSRQIVADGKRQRLEERLNKFVVALYSAADRRKRERIEEERRRRQRIEDEKRRVEEERRRWEESQRIQRLERGMEAWEKANRIRAYVDAVRREAETTASDSSSDGDLAGWVRWALGYADRLDPLKD